MQNIDELESFLLKHGENIVDLLGGEIDRIELKLKVSLVQLISDHLCSESISFCGSNRKVENKMF